MVREIFINTNDTMLVTMGKIASAFSDAGWEVVVDPESPTADFTVTSPGKVGDNFPLVVKFVADTNDPPFWQRGVKMILYLRTYPTVDTPREFLTTICTGGKYAFVIHNYGFVIIPPDVQTHRFQYGTWVGLLDPAYPFYTPPPSQWARTPLFLATDRISREVERTERHINPSSPGHFIQFPNGDVLQTFNILTATLGMGTLLEKVTEKVLLPLTFVAEWGEHLIPIFRAPSFFVEVDPRKVLYLHLESYKDFLKPKVFSFATLVPCGELPPQGAILLAEA